MGFFKKFKKNNKGFSIIEIFMVVVIIGLLAAVAVPNYIHHVYISRQAEAKANLASLASAEKAFWTEFAGYTSQIDSIGFNPQGTLYYGYGFSTGIIPGTGLNVSPAALQSAFPTYDNTSACYQTATGPGGGAPACTGVASYRPQWTNSSNVRNNFGSGETAPNPTTSFTGTNSWYAFARANLNGSSDDEWYIDSHDNLTNGLSGI